MNMRDLEGQPLGIWFIFGRCYPEATGQNEVLTKLQRLKLLIVHVKVNMEILR